MIVNEKLFIIKMFEIAYITLIYSLHIIYIFKYRHIFCNKNDIQCIQNNKLNSEQSYKAEIYTSPLMVSEALMCGVILNRQLYSVGSHAQA